MTESGASVTRVLFVCLGNICRSPTAEGVFASLVRERGLGTVIEVDSCGTAGWHAGEAPDPRSVAAALGRGVDLRALRARQLQRTDFHRFHYILAMDHANLAELQRLCPADFGGHLGLFMEYAPTHRTLEVPDPYYGGDEGFQMVLDLAAEAGQGLLEAVLRRRGLD